jgi:hypothetical protein
MPLLRPLALGLLLATALAAPAFAQGAPPTGEVVVTEEARAKFRAGVALLQDPDGARYEEAYLAFKAAYAISPSPNILGNLGLTALKLERDGEAIEAYTGYLAKGTNIDPSERKQVETDLATMKSTLATVKLLGVPSDASIVDERVPSRGTPVRNRYSPSAGPATVLGVRTGLHRFTISKPGFREQVIELDLTPGQTVESTIALEPSSGTLPVGGTTGPTNGRGPNSPGPLAPSSTDGSDGPGAERPIPTGFWVGLGITGALAVGTGVVGVLALGQKSTFDEANGVDPVAAQDARDTGTVLNITTDVLLGSTIAAGAVTAVLYFTRPEASATETSIHLVPTGTGAALVGRF